MTKKSKIKEPLNNDEEYRKYLISANNGVASDQYILGLMYDSGIAVEQDYEKAVSWYFQSAKQKYKQAEFALGTMYAAGSGVPQSNLIAFMWYSVSARNGYSKADDQRLIVAKRMTPEELKRADIMSSDPLNFTDLEA